MTPSNKKCFTAIFKWVENERGEEEQVREWIDKRAWSHEWFPYGDTQHFYHSDCDEWDLCEAFDSQTHPSFIDNDDKFDNDNIPMESREPSPSPPHPPTSPPPPDSDIWEGHLPVQPSFMSHRDQFVTIKELLHLHYGFHDSSRIQPIDPAICILETPKVLWILGYLKSPTTINLTPNALHFITLMVLHSYDGDFVPISNMTTPLTIAPNHQFRILLFPSTVGIMYILSSKRSPNPRWHLALTSATTALECIQCASTNIEELVSFLVQSERAFKTHHSCDQIPLSIYRYSPPIIRPSYQSVLQLPTVQEDYTYYEETCTNFLSLVQAHAALLQGSIVWCLAIKALGDRAEDVVLNGPLDDVLKFGSKICYNGNKLWDDRLNEAEMDLICGVYKLYSKC